MHREMVTENLTRFMYDNMYNLDLHALFARELRHWDRSRYEAAMRDINRQLREGLI